MKKTIISAVFVIGLFAALPAAAQASYMMDTSWHYPSYPYSSFTGQGYYTSAGMDPYYYGYVGNQNPAYQPSYGCGWYSSCGGGYGGEYRSYGNDGLVYGGYGSNGGYGRGSYSIGGNNVYSFAIPTVTVYGPNWAW